MFRYAYGYHISEPLPQRQLLTNNSLGFNVCHTKILVVNYIVHKQALYIQCTIKFKIFNCVSCELNTYFQH